MISVTIVYYYYCYRTVLCNTWLPSHWRALCLRNQFLGNRRAYFRSMKCFSVWDEVRHITGPITAQIREQQEAQLSPRDRAMRLVSSNLANYHATGQKLLIWQVLTKSMVWSWRFSRRQCVIDNVHSTMTLPSRFHCLRCVINKPTTDDLCISPVYRRLAVAKFSKSTMKKSLTWPWPRPLRKHSLITRLRLRMA